MNWDKILTSTMQNWRYEDAAWDFSNEDREHIEDILKNDPVIAEFCTRCAESAMTRYRDQLKEKSYNSMKVTSGFCTAGAGMIVLSKLFKR